MSRTVLSIFSILLISLASCRRHEQAADSASTDSATISDSAQSESEEEEAMLPEVHTRGWMIFQEAVDSTETQVQVWAPGDHLKEAFSTTVKNLYRQHYHFADWSDSTLFAIRRLGDVDHGNWTDELWEYRDGREPRRVASGRGIDFRVSPKGSLLAVSAVAPGTGEERITIFDRSRKELASRKTMDLGFESTAELWLGDSILYAEGDGVLARWSLQTDSVTNVALPGAGNDRAILPDRDLLVASDAPDELVNDGPNEAADKRTKTLRAYGLINGKKAEIARGAGRQFHPRFVEGDSLEFDIPSSKEEKRLAAPL